jgi:4-amino-4-deoxy-L-arabinose transferase-like glycosyltransferase
VSTSQRPFWYVDRFRFLGVCVFYALVWLAGTARRLPLWYDESLTVRLAKLDSVGELWRALTSGFEFNPPLIYLLTKAALLTPGSELFTARLPGLAGYALLSMTLFEFLRRRLGGWLALASVVLLPLATYTVLYSMEARAYMPLLGVSGCALVCWQAAADGRSRFASIGLAVSVALALLLHVWASLLLLTLLVGETIAFLQSKRIRWPIVGALAAAMPVIAIYPTLLRASRTVIFSGPAYAPSLDKLIGAFRVDVPRPRVIAGVLVARRLVGAPPWRPHDRARARFQRLGAGRDPVAAALTDRSVRLRQPV